MHVHSGEKIMKEGRGYTLNDMHSKTYITACLVALDLLCPLDCDFPLGIHVPYHMYVVYMYDIEIISYV